MFLMFLALRTKDRKGQTKYYPDWYLWLTREQRAWGWR